MDLDCKFYALCVFRLMILLIILYIIKSFKNLESKFTELKKEYKFNQSFMIAYEKLKNKKFEQNEINNKYHIYYLLLLFSKKISNSITFISNDNNNNNKKFAKIKLKNDRR